MTDLPAVPSALGIEAVECLEEDGNVIVRITGRWRERRPEWPGPALLVIESEGMRHRFPALPERPAYADAGGDAWRMSFAVAAELAPQLVGRAWLQLGSLVVPLPLFAEAKLRSVADEAMAHRVARAGAPETLAARDLRSAEAEARSARNRAAHAEADVAELVSRVESLEDSLERAREEAERLRSRLGEADRQRRLAEQRAHAEAAQRSEAEEALATRARASEEALSRAATLSERIEELEQEHRTLRRAADEAAHAAAGLRAARAVAESRLEELSGQYTRLAALTLLSARAPTPETPAEPSRGPSAEVDQVRRLLVRERAARAAAERRAERLERVLSGERRRWANAAAGIEEIRLELDELRTAHAALEGTPAPPPPAPVVTAPAAAPASSAVAPPPPSAPDPAVPAPPAPSPAPLTAELPAPPEPTSGQSVKPWLAPVFRGLVEDDPISAGRLVLALLPAQGVVRPGPIAYDLILGDMAAVQVTVADGATQVRFGEHPRPAGAVDFQVTGDLAGLAQLLAAGRFRRRLGRGLAKVQGDRSGLAALRQLLRSSVSLRRLHAAGVRVDPGLGLLIGARMIDPAWTLGERFTIAHQVPGARAADAFIEICDGRPPAIRDRPPAGEPAATVVGPGEGLLPALAGARGESLFVRGDQRVLGLLAQWLDRAQSA